MGKAIVGASKLGLNTAEGSTCQLLRFVPYLRNKRATFLESGFCGGVIRLAIGIIEGFDEMHALAQEHDGRTSLQRNDDPGRPAGVGAESCRSSLHREPPGGKTGNPA